MRGFPKHLNTRADYEYVRINFPPEQWRPAFQRLLDDRFSWLPSGPLKDNEEGVEDKTHRVIEFRDENGKTAVERVQEEYREDPNAVIFRVGFRVEEVEEILNNQ